MYISRQLLFNIVYSLPCALGLVAASSALSSTFPDPHHDKLGAVASESSECSKVGISILQKGGNAADAMVATTFCVGTIGMYHSGIGGGGFALVRSPNGTYEMIDFREKAPAAANKEMCNGNYNGSIFGGLACGVPGELRGLEYLHQHYGVLSWKDVIQPAIHIARDGFPVTQDLLNYIQKAYAQSLPGDNFLVTDPAWAIDFAPNGTLLTIGDTITRRRYADTLQTISEQGADVFYEGAIANATIQAVRAANGTMTLEDLKNYTVAIRNPVQISYRDFRITSCSAPSGGEVVLAGLKIVEGYDDFGYADAVNISTYRLNEAMRWAYAERAQLGDPDYVAGTQAYEQDMISAKTAKEIRAKITKNTHKVKYYDPKGLGGFQNHGTSQISTADHTGLGVSLTTTINLLFGSQLIVPETGIIMNDEMNDFSIPGSSNAFGYVPTPNNYIKPGKRPLSSMSPTIAEFLSNGTLYFLTGAAGGSQIITATMQNLWHVLDQNMTSIEALTSPRLHDQLEPNVVSLEYTYNNGTAAFLKERGANVTFVAPGSSAAQAVRLLPNGTFEAAGEPRVSSSGGYAI